MAGSCVWGCGDGAPRGRRGSPSLVPHSAPQPPHSQAQPARGLLALSLRQHGPPCPPPRGHFPCWGPQAGRDGTSTTHGTRAVLHPPSPVLPVLGVPVPRVGAPAAPRRGGSVGRGSLPPSMCPRGALGPGAVGLPLARPWRSRSLCQVSLLSPAAACGARHPAAVPARRVNKAGSQLPALPPRHHVQPAATLCAAARSTGTRARGTRARGHEGTGARVLALQPPPPAPSSRAHPLGGAGARLPWLVARLRVPRALAACLGAWLQLWGCPSAAASWFWCSPRRGAELRPRHAAAGASVPGTARGAAAWTGTAAACALWTRAQGARGGRGAGSTWLLPPAAGARRVLVSPLLIGPAHHPLPGMC